MKSIALGILKPVVYLAGIRLYPRFMPVPTSSLNSFDPDEVRKNVEKGIYPSVQAQGVGTRETKGQGKARFLFCPFRTSADQDSVYFIERIKVTYECHTAKEQRAFPMAVSDASIANADSKLSGKIAYSKKLDNVIITVDSLKNAFLPLRDWKRKKGMHCELLTVEEIASIYTQESTLPHQIKRALHCLYRNYNLESVTIGGDGRIVPTFLGYSPVLHYFDNPSDTLKSRYVPTDHFYLCFDGDFYWNANGNEIAGELDDNVSFEPYLTIGRLPSYDLKTSQHVVSNFLSYEQGLHDGNHFNNMLAIADRIKSPDTLIDGYYFTDSHLISKKIYNNWIAPFNNQVIFKIFSNNLDDGKTNWNYNVAGLKQELKTGPAFINISAHGMNDHIYIQNDKFSRTDITNEVAGAQSIILASSWHTGNFSRYQNNNSTIPTKYIVAGYTVLPTCFGSGWLIQNGARAIAYIGNTREGWGGDKNGELGSTDLWHAYIWKNIFDEHDERSIGRVLRDIKYEYRLNDYEYAPGRRMLMSENMMGDPDIKAFTDSPSKFQDIKIYPGIGYWNINTGGITGHKVYIGYLHNGVYEYESFPVDTPTKYIFRKNHFSIAITKHNFIPYFRKFDLRCVGDFNTLYLQNVDITEDLSIEAPQIRIGQQVSNLKRTGEVIFLQGHSSIKGGCVTLEPGTEICIGASVSIN